ncbi:hypothetical protein EVAR_2788_1 [Eumeta japonica]|uniref:Uncharacterized protein n=1 Tax=Eumeta variegata TaxID=151549 RepID=A0A4C1SZN6_EUMVA|nr:hypothetical protein EVAR_2788_1 [Eumeta japonica]
MFRKICLKFVLFFVEEFHHARKPALQQRFTVYEDAIRLQDIHGHSQPYGSHQYVSNHLKGNRIYNEGGTGLTEEREGSGPPELSLTRRKTTEEAATSARPNKEAAMRRRTRACLYERAATPAGARRLQPDDLAAGDARGPFRKLRS